jgi:hypothetical protein
MIKYYKTFIKYNYIYVLEINKDDEKLKLFQPLYVDFASNNFSKFAYKMYEPVGAYIGWNLFDNNAFNLKIKNLLLEEIIISYNKKKYYYVMLELVVLPPIINGFLGGILYQEALFRWSLIK